MNIAVLAGGLSTERDVSLSTGSMVCNALCGYGHMTALVDAYLGVENYAGSPEKYFSLSSREVTKVPEIAPDLSAIKNRSVTDSKSFFGPGVLQICAAADKVFIALHGENGEDGRVQAALDLMGIAYTGTGYFGSALAMDKDMSKKLLQGVGVPTAKWVFVNKGEDAAADTMSSPCVI